MNFLKNLFKKYPVFVSLVILSAIYTTFKSLNFKPKMNTIKNNFNEEDAKKAILKVREVYGVPMAQIVEKMFRWETAHFKSGQYKATGTAGMTKGAWSGNVPTDTINFKTNPSLDSGGRSNIDYIVWNPTDFALYLANYIKKFNGNFGRWFSTNIEKQKSYMAKVNTIKSKFV